MVRDALAAALPQAVAGRIPGASHNAVDVARPALVEHVADYFAG